MHAYIHTYTYIHTYIHAYTCIDIQVWSAGGRSKVVTLNLSVGGDKVSGGGGGGEGAAHAPTNLDSVRVEAGENWHIF